VCVFTNQAFDDDPQMKKQMAADLIAVMERDPACEKYSQPLLYFKGFQALQAYRVSHLLWTQGRKSLALALQSRVSEVFQVVRARLPAVSCLAGSFDFAWDYHAESRGQRSCMMLALRPSPQLLCCMPLLAERVVMTVHRNSDLPERTITLTDVRTARTVGTGHPPGGQNRVWGDDRSRDGCGDGRDGGCGRQCVAAAPRHAGRHGHHRRRPPPEGVMSHTHTHTHTHTQQSRVCCPCTAVLVKHGTHTS
jgi:hypothetical protein